MKAMVSMSILTTVAMLVVAAAVGIILWQAIKVDAEKGAQRGLYGATSTGGIGAEPVIETETEIWQRALH